LCELLSESMDKGNDFVSLYFLIKENNGRVIEAAGENLHELADLGILLDDEDDKSKYDRR
jgi:hypothetical protein